MLRCVSIFADFATATQYNHTTPFHIPYAILQSALKNRAYILHISTLPSTHYIAYHQQKKRVKAAKKISRLIILYYH